MPRTQKRMSMRSSCTPVFGDGDVFQIDGRAIVLADDEIVVLLGGRQLSLRLQQESAVRAVKLARAGVAGSVLDRSRSRSSSVMLRTAIAEGSALIRTADCVPYTRNLADAGKNADTLADLGIGIIVELALGNRVADQRDIHDRLIVRIRFGECGRAWQIDGELSLGAGDGGLHIGGSAVEALRKIELQDEAGVSLPVVGGHQFQTRESA